VFGMQTERLLAWTVNPSKRVFELLLNTWLAPFQILRELTQEEQSVNFFRCKESQKQSCTFLLKFLGDQRTSLSLSKYILRIQLCCVALQFKELSLERLYP
jgi:hypothetical protein